MIGLTLQVGVSYIELDKEVITQEELQKVEDECNKAIRDHVKVEVKLYDLNDPALSSVRKDDVNCQYFPLMFNDCSFSLY